MPLASKQKTLADERADVAYQLRCQGLKLKDIGEQLLGIKSGKPLGKERTRQIIARGERRQKVKESIAKVGIGIDVRNLPDETVITDEIVDAMELSVRTTNCVKNISYLVDTIWGKPERVLTIGELKMLIIGKHGHHTPITCCPNFGRKSYLELKIYFHDHIKE